CIASVSLERIVEKMNVNPKVEQVFITDIAGKPVDWDMVFQFNLDNEDPFFVEIKMRKVKVLEGKASEPDILMTGDNNAIVRICEGKGDFTHAISREEITVEKGKVIEVIRLTRAITTALKTK
ncbi:MAG: SCP2 sterol-binding domain-containing protein, partial [Promethearchaeia archaeon]